MDTPGRMLTKKDVADLLGVSTKTVQRRVNAGLLPAVRISARGDLRFDRDAIDAYLAANAA